MKVNDLRKLVWSGIAVVVLGVPVFPALARVRVNVNIELPPLIAFPGPPEVVVIPGTYVYVAPDVAEDIFFFEGWWWRPWNGHWYRSPFYDHDWGYYSGEPGFYRDVPPGWRDDYRRHEWHGQPWNYERIDHDQMERNWNGWERDHYWEHHDSWGVRDYNPHGPAEHHDRGPQPPPPPPNRHNNGPQPGPSSNHHNNGPQPGPPPNHHNSGPQPGPSSNHHNNGPQPAPPSSHSSGHGGNQGHGNGNHGHGSGSKGHGHGGHGGNDHGGDHHR